jgi:hypothetical protein
MLPLSTDEAFQTALQMFCASERSRSQHFGVVWSAHRKM